MSDSGAPETAREEFVLTWFVTAGATQVQRTVWAEPELARPDAASNRWSLPDIAADEDGAAGDRVVEVFVVVRDGRGGVGWSAAQLLVGP